MEIVIVGDKVDIYLTPSERQALLKEIAKAENEEVILTQENNVVTLIFLEEGQ